VEDSLSDVTLIREALSESGYRYDLTVANCPAQAYKISAEKPFDLILCDYCGNILDGGPAFIGRLRKRLSLTSIVVLSGYTDVRRAYRAGANAFVRKANGLPEFFEKVRGIMRFWVDVADLPSHRDDISQ
jgi:CheY-like chemotaxis protein